MEKIAAEKSYLKRGHFVNVFRPWLNKINVVEIISYAFIVLFVYTGVFKFMDFPNFKAVIGQSPLITSFASILAYAVPITEIVISILLGIPRFRLVGLCAAFDLMLCFTAYIIILLSLSIHLPCSCGGVIQKMTWSQHLVFNIIFTLLALLGIFLHNRTKVK